MTNDQLRQYAERIVSDKTWMYWEGDGPIQASAVAAAYLADNPADSETEIDEVWLRSVGFSGPQYEIATPEIAGYKGELSWLPGWGFITQYDNDAEDDSCVQVRLLTRGDVRRLASALGITLVEPK